MTTPNMQDLTEIMENENTNSIAEFEWINEKEGEKLIKKIDTTKASNMGSIIKF